MTGKNAFRDEYADVGTKLGDNLSVFDVVRSLTGSDGASAFMFSIVTHPFFLFGLLMRRWFTAAPECSSSSQAFLRIPRWRM